MLVNFVIATVTFIVAIGIHIVSFGSNNNGNWLVYTDCIALLVSLIFTIRSLSFQKNDFDMNYWKIKSNESFVLHFIKTRPTWFFALAIISFFYGIVHLVIAASGSFSGMPEIRNGAFVLVYKDSITKTISENDYIQIESSIKQHLTAFMVTGTCVLNCFSFYSIKLLKATKGQS